MTLQGSAFLAMWHDIAAEGEAEYSDWHTREHMAERVGIPGFLVGRRYVDWSLDKHRWFTIYEGRTLDTFNSAPYLERLNAPTPWSNRMQPHFRNMVRAACSTVVSTGRGVGGAMLTARLDFSHDGREAFTSAAADIAARLGEQHGVTGVHVGVAEVQITNVRTAETELRKTEGVYDATLLVDGIGRRELKAIQQPVRDLLTAPTGVARATIAVYDLAYLLSSD